MKDELEALTRFCIGNHELEQLEAMLGEFNLFEAAGLTSQEIRHSRFLSFLLDPQESHGLGSAFATKLLQTAVQTRPLDEVHLTALDIELMDIRDFQVICESNQIDILLLSSSNKFAVIIENKIGSGEHSNQLKRYLDHISESKPLWRVLPILLSPDGIEPTESQYFPVSYENVIEILAVLLDARRASLGPDVALVLTHYVNLLRRHVVSNSKLNELCLQIINKHRKALELLMAHMDSPKTRAKTVVDGLLEDAGWLKVSFYRYPPDWNLTVPSGYDGHPIVLFWVDYASKSLSIVMEIQPGDDIVRQKILDAALASKLFNPARKTLGAKYNRILRRDICSTSSPSDQDTEEWETHVREGFNRFVLDVMPEVAASLKGAV